MASQAAPQIVMTFARNLRDARSLTRSTEDPSRPLSRRELATALGVDQLAIYRWETGKVRPSVGNLAALAQFFDRDLGWFYTDHDGAKAA